MITMLLKKISYPIQGVFYALRYDLSYQIQVFGGAFAVGLFIFFVGELEKIDYLFLGLAWTLILITEIQNSALEVAIDRMHPEQHNQIGRSKDMAAGAVLIAGFFLVFVMAVILWF